MKSIGRDCLIFYTKNKNSTICFTIYKNPEFDLKETDPIILEINSFKTLNIATSLNIKYKSNHPDIIKVDDKGKITAIRPGNAIITIFESNNIYTQIKVLANSNKGFLNNFTLDMYNASQYKKVMIVAHPDDETLWGGANLFKDRYFVICFTNGYNIKRANDFREILKFTNNSGIILNYPDFQDNIIDDWRGVKNGILKDLSTILNYQYWDKIVTHGPDGTTGHIHHKKLSSYVTETAKKLKKFNKLYYFGKFYKKSEIPKNLPKINDTELESKIKEVEIYKSVKHIVYVLWFHMLPYENWISALKWKK